jgi:putative transposase
VKAAVRAVVDEHACYGYRRVTALLKRRGLNINHKRVQRTMQELGLQVLRKLGKFRSYRGPGHVAVPNLIKRNFKATEPNKRWVTDVTEFAVGGEKCYLSPIMDLYNGEIVAFQIERRPTLSLVQKMVRKALGKLGKDEAPVLHSDQGWHYQHAAYRRLLSQKGLKQSMSAKGNCLDNAAMESFFGLLKSEFFYRTRFDSIAQLQDGIRRYIRYYNHKRIKLKLNGLSPVEYRAQAAAV